MDALYLGAIVAFAFGMEILLVARKAAYSRTGALLTAGIATLLAIVTPNLNLRFYLISLIAAMLSTLIAIEWRRRKLGRVA